jgi:hypothetical protein
MESFFSFFFFSSIVKNIYSFFFGKNSPKFGNHNTELRKNNLKIKN